MKNKEFKTKFVHSLSKPAWNVAGCEIGGKYKIARVSYVFVEGDEVLTTQNKHKAMIHAKFISDCFNKWYNKD